MKNKPSFLTYLWFFYLASTIIGIDWDSDIRYDDVIRSTIRSQQRDVATRDEIDDGTRLSLPYASSSNNDLTRLVMSSSRVSRSVINRDQTTGNQDYWRPRDWRPETDYTGGYQTVESMLSGHISWFFIKRYDGSTRGHPALVKDGHLVNHSRTKTIIYTFHDIPAEKVLWNVRLGPLKTHTISFSKPARPGRAMLYVKMA
ncbi:hypothetical protein PSTT_12730 [Puccinia striiformis]|uniref:Secreted protein n=1 Tax=Puccinia striiformis TaxID=27350 RepID=A0A2S4UUW2_9BASI|nr:hypothetical protein PSTT_12730 [Puccinia striiformis]